MDRRHIFLVVVILATAMAYLTIVVGGDLTASGSGLACGGSWPFCPGGVIPNFTDFGVVIEFTHRVVAFATSLLVLAALLLAIKWFRRASWLLYLSVVTFLLLAAQVLLGMATVQSNLNDAVVTAHLALGTATFAAALVLTVVMLIRPPPAQTPAAPS